MGQGYFRAIFLHLVCLVMASPASAQKFRLTGYGSYVLDGTYHIYYENGDFYEGKINRGLQLGLGMEYMVAPNYGIEFTSLRMCTNVFPEGVVNFDRSNADLRFNYYLLGLNTYPQTKPTKLQFFGGASAGVIVQSASNRINLSDNTINRTITKFAWAARLGGIGWMSSRVGVKLQTQWLSSLQFQNGIVNFDVHRLGVGPADCSIANQLEIGTGLVVKIGKATSKEHSLTFR